MEAMCSECGGVWESGTLFDLDRRGPPWSIEHGKRRLVRRGLGTGARAFAPALLWRGLQPEHRVVPARLAILGAAWLLVLHLGGGALLGLSALGLAAYGSSALSGWRWWNVRSGSFWGAMGRRAVWPYPGHIEVATSANSTMSNPVSEFVTFALVPQLVMAGLVWVWLRRSRPGMAGHVARGAVLSLPVAVAWVWIGSGAFVAAVIADEWYGVGSVSGLLWLGSIAGLFATIVWWWRQFVVAYLGHRRGQWVLVLLGFLSFVITWFLAAGIEWLERAAR